MFDIFIYYLKSENYLIEVDSTKVDDAIKFFNVFRIKRKVRVHF